MTGRILIPAAIIILSLAYYLARKARWREILRRAADYHRFHLNEIRRSAGVDDGSRELAHSMLMVIERQFARDLKGSPGLFGIFRAFIGDRNALSSMNAIAEKIYYDRMVTGVPEVDPRLERLFATMAGMMFRHHMLTSVLGPAAVLYMDLLLLLAAARIDRRGSSRLYRDIARGRA